jgi:iron(II)-dependent oxidoreductase
MTQRYLASIVSLAITCSSACTGDDGSASTSETTDATETSSESGSETETGDGDSELGELVDIAGASFAMGCGASDSSCDQDNPEHQVTVSAFAIEKTEVSVVAYRACVDAGMCTPPAMDIDCNYGVTGRDNHPVNCVTWQQAADYCTFAGRRLPSEAEWELAAASETSRTFPWGEAAATCTFAHMFQMNGDTGGYGCLTNVTANTFDYYDGASVEGVLQLAGNVDEWVNDWYAADYYMSGETTDPQGPASGTEKVNRGGDMYDASALNLRTFERRFASPDAAAPERGFRCAL